MDEITLKKHLGIGEKFSLIANDGTETEFTFLPLTTEYIPDVYKYTISVVSGKPLTTEEILIGVKLAEATVKISYPDWKDEIVKSFVANNFIAIIDVVRQLNQLGIKKSKKIMEFIDEKRKVGAIATKRDE